MILQEILSKLEALDSRVATIESKPQNQEIKGPLSPGEGGVITGRTSTGMDYYSDRITRQTKIEFPTFDGNRVQDWLFRSERFFELDGTPAELKVSMASVYRSCLARIGITLSLRAGG